jgi:hypothetical protein
MEKINYYASHYFFNDLADFCGVPRSYYKEQFYCCLEFVILMTYNLIQFTDIMINAFLMGTYINFIKPYTTAMYNEFIFLIS